MRTKREQWREEVWLHLNGMLLPYYGNRNAFQWLLDVMYYADTSATDAVMMMIKLFPEPRAEKISGMQLLHEWRVDPDDALETMEGGRPDHDGHG